MPNFTQIIAINADRQTNITSLKVSTTKSGKAIYSGRMYWSTGRKNKDGGKEFGNMHFYTWDENIYKLFKNNPTDSFLVNATLYPDNWRDEKKGIDNKQFKACIIAASIHEWEKTK